MTNKGKAADTIELETNLHEVQKTIMPTSAFTLKTLLRHYAKRALIGAFYVIVKLQAMVRFQLKSYFKISVHQNYG